MEYIAKPLAIFATLLFGIIVVPGMDMIFVLWQCARRRHTGADWLQSWRHHGWRHRAYDHRHAGRRTVLTVLIPQLVRLPMLLAGAAYMIWIGYTLDSYAARITVDEVAGSDRAAPSSRSFWRGLLTCMLNPKAWLFIIAVYPQFMKPQFGHLWQQAIVMGLLTIAMQLLIYGTIVLAAATSRNFLLTNHSATAWAGRLAGALLIAAAVWTGWQGWTYQA
jgi:threonine/homoserine/homoserine lactone efflux protein